MRIAVKFNLGQLQSIKGESIKNVSLSLHKMPSYGNYGSDLKYKKEADYYVHTGLSSWDESWTKEKACWEMDSELNVAVSDPLDTIRYQTNDLGWFTYDVTSAVKQILDGEIDNNGFVMSCHVFGQLQLSGNQAGFYASEYSEGDTLRPKLTIVYDNTVSIINHSVDKSPLIFDSAEKCHLIVRDLSGRILDSHSNIAYGRIDEVVGNRGMIQLLTITNSKGFSITQKFYK